eukprot:257493-Chlamydomonas_euryale.AAC.9
MMYVGAGGGSSRGVLQYFCRALHPSSIFQQPCDGAILRRGKREQDSLIFLREVLQVPLSLVAHDAICH